MKYSEEIVLSSAIVCGIGAIVYLIGTILGWAINVHTLSTQKKVACRGQDKGEAIQTPIKAFFQSFVKRFSPIKFAKRFLATTFAQRIFTTENGRRFRKLVEYLGVLEIVFITLAVFVIYNNAERRKMLNYMVRRMNAEIAQKYETRVLELILSVKDEAAQKLIPNLLLSSTTKDVAIEEVWAYAKNNKYLFNKNMDINTPPLYLISPAYLDKDGNPQFLTQDERNKILICMEKAGGIDIPLTIIMMEVLGCEEVISNLEFDYLYNSEVINLKYYDKLAIIIGYINGKKIQSQRNELFSKHDP